MVFSPELCNICMQIKSGMESALKVLASSKGASTPETSEL